MLLTSNSGLLADQPASSPILRFRASVLKKDLAKARDNLSAVVFRDNTLWLGGDEGTSIDRMTRDHNGNFGDHARFELKDILNLPAPAKQEIDIEGLDLDGGYLWLIGSHSANAALEAARQAKAPIIIQLSHGGAQFYAGKFLDNSKQLASITGGIAGALHAT